MPLRRAVVVDASHNAIVTFSLGSANLWANRCTTSTTCTNWSTATQIDTTSGGILGGSGLNVVPATGNAVASWATSIGGIYGVYANFYTAGTGWGTMQTVNTNGLSAAGGHQAMNTSGATFDVWVAYDGISTYSIWASKLQ